jgi:hypothetical protein
MNRRDRLIIALLFGYFFFPTASTYLSLAVGVGIPQVADMFFCIVLLASVRAKNKLYASDLLFVVPMALFFIALLRFEDTKEIFFNYEARGLFAISLMYYSLRLFGVSESAKTAIGNNILKILTISVYLLPVEFVLINFAELYIAIESAYLEVYPARERLYEKIFIFAKPFGLFIGTHNASVAAAILIIYLMFAKRHPIRKLTMFMACFSFVICFSLSVFMVTTCIIAAISFARVKSAFGKASITVFSIALISILYVYGDVITTLRSGGDIGGVLGYGSSAESVYYLSFKQAQNSLLANPMGVTQIVNFTNNEVYLSRLIMIYGLLIIPFLVYLFWSTGNAVLQVHHHKSIIQIGSLMLLLTSLHYPSMISYPLMIFIPLAGLFRPNQISIKVG